jgi:hypothetical protein
VRFAGANSHHPLVGGADDQRTRALLVEDDVGADASAAQLEAAAQRREGTVFEEDEVELIDGDERRCVQCERAAVGCADGAAGCAGELRVGGKLAAGCGGSPRMKSVRPYLRAAGGRCKHRVDRPFGAGRRGGGGGESR